MLDVETRGSASLLNLQQFTDPFSYRRCKNLSVNCFLAAATQPLRVRWSSEDWETGKIYLSIVSSFPPTT